MYEGMYVCIDVRVCTQSEPLHATKRCGDTYMQISEATYSIGSRVRNESWELDFAFRRWTYVDVEPSDPGSELTWVEEFSDAEVACKLGL